MQNQLLSVDRKTRHLEWATPLWMAFGGVAEALPLELGAGVGFDGAEVRG